MIIVLGNISVKETNIDQAMSLSQEHVARSRTEPGCISHAVYLDPEQSGRLVFVEKWSDMESLQLHFKVPASAQFVKALESLATDKPIIEIFEANPAG